MATTTKLPISALPLPPLSHLLTHNLIPDSHTPSVSVFQNQVLTTKPSLQRRARLLAPQSHFSYVSPLPLPFPYDIEPPVPSEPVEDQGLYVEKWLSNREAVHERTPTSNMASSILRKYFPENRDQPRELMGLSETGLKDCLPHLDVGDAFSLLGAPALANYVDEEGSPCPSDSEAVVSVRQELVDVLSGHAILMSGSKTDTGGDGSGPAFAPWSLRYSGHQFGTWAGQLGDGRAISIR